MGWGTIGGMIGGSIGSAISNALKGNGGKPNNSGGSSGSGYIKPNNTGGVSGRVPSVSGGSSISSGSQSSFGGSGGGSSGSFGGGYTNPSIGYSQADFDKDMNEMRQNSAAWHTATPEEKKLLEQANQRYGSKWGMGYDSSTGKWYGATRPTPSYQETGMQDYFDEMEAANNAATQAAVEQGKLQLQQQLPQIQQGYDEMARQAYIQYMNAKKDLPQQLAAAGISGQGAAESTISQQSNTYNNTLSQSELARQEYIRQINNSMANLEATGNLQYAQNAADTSKLAMQAYQDFLKQQQEQAYNDRLFALQTGGLMGQYGGVPTFDKQKWETEKKDNAAANAYEREMEAFRNAMSLWNQTGYADQGIVNTLNKMGYNISLGAGTSDQRYKDAQLALDRYLASRG